MTKTKWRRRQTGNQLPLYRLMRTLSVYEDGEYHALVLPYGSGWRDVSANRPLTLTPTHWRLWGIGHI